MPSKQDGIGDPHSGQSADLPPTDRTSEASAGSDPAGSAPQDREQDQAQAIEQEVRHTRIGAAWVVIIIAIIVLVLLLIFILQNPQNVTVTYFGASGQIPLGVVLLFAAIGGALLVAIVGVARLTQLRLNARRRRRASDQTRSKSQR